MQILIMLSSNGFADLIPQSFLFNGICGGDYMILGAIIEFVVGVICIVMGVLLWKKQKVSILHDYHYKHVKKLDIPAYTRQMGIGLIIIGAGIIITGLLNLAYSSLWWIPLLAGFVIGLVIIILAQKKYNGSVLG